MRKYLIWLGCAMALYLAQAWENVKATRLGYEIGRIEEELDYQESVNQHLRLDIEKLKSPFRLSALARERLKMSVTEPDMIVLLSEETAPRPETFRWLAKLFRSGNSL